MANNFIKAFSNINVCEYKYMKTNSAEITISP